MIATSIYGLWVVQPRQALLYMLVGLTFALSLQSSTALEYPIYFTETSPPHQEISVMEGNIMKMQARFPWNGTHIPNEYVTLELVSMFQNGPILHRYNLTERTPVLQWINETEEDGNVRESISFHWDLDNGEAFTQTVTVWKYDKVVLINGTIDSDTYPDHRFTNPETLFVVGGAPKIAWNATWYNKSPGKPNERGLQPTISGVLRWRINLDLQSEEDLMTFFSFDTDLLDRKQYNFTVKSKYIHYLFTMPSWGIQTQTGKFDPLFNWTFDQSYFFYLISQILQIKGVANITLPFDMACGEADADGFFYDPDFNTLFLGIRPDLSPHPPIHLTSPDQPSSNVSGEVQPIWWIAPIVVIVVAVGFVVLVWRVPGLRKKVFPFLGRSEKAKN